MTNDTFFPGGRPVNPRRNRRGGFRNEIMKKETRGRPRKPKSKVRSESLTIRLTPAEKKEIFEAADKIDETVPDTVLAGIRLLASNTVREIANYFGVPKHVLSDNANFCSFNKK
jgi:hypothetical protein